MADAIAAGSILIEEGAYPPDSSLPRSVSDSNGWAALNGARSAFEKEIRETGWTFFFMAGEIDATVFGFDRQKTLRAALKPVSYTHLASGQSHCKREISALQQYRDYPGNG